MTETSFNYQLLKDIQNGQQQLGQGNSATQCFIILFGHVSCRTEPLRTL